jgi:hypothetical protein
MRLDRDIMGWLAHPHAPHRGPPRPRGRSLARLRRPLDRRPPRPAHRRRAEIEAGISAAFVTDLDAAREALERAGREPRIVAANGVIGSRVFDAEGRKVGRIADLSIDKETGRIVYALIGVEGAFGFLKRLDPAPWRLLRYDAKRDGYVAPADKADVEGAPPLSAEQLRDLGLGDNGWQERLATYYNPFLAGPFV